MTSSGKRRCAHTHYHCMKPYKTHSYASHDSQAIFGSKFTVLTSALLDNNLCAKCKLFLCRSIKSQCTTCNG